MDADTQANVSPHAALPGRITTAWQADGLPQRPTWATILLATRECGFGHELGSYAIKEVVNIKTVVVR